MLWAVIVIVGVLLDQITKQLVIRNIGFESPVPIINGFFYLNHRENTGAAWSMFQNGRYFFIALTAIIAVIMVYFLIKTDSRLLRFVLSVLLGGALGNFTDRVVKGRVVDFLDFHFGTYVFPTFNVSDCLVVIGTILLGVYLLFVYKESALKADGEKSDGR